MVNYELIKKLMKENNISLYKLSIATHINYETLKKLLYQKRDIKLSQLTSIATALNVSIEDIIINK